MGNDITVNINGTDYPSKVRVLNAEGLTAIYIGNISLLSSAFENTGEDFLVFSETNSNPYVCAVKTELNPTSIGIGMASLVIAPLDYKFVPDNLPSRCIPAQAFPEIIYKDYINQNSTADDWQDWFNKFCSGVRFVLRTSNLPTNETYTVLSIFYSDSVGGQIAYIDARGKLHVGIWDSKSGYTEKAVNLIETLIPQTSDAGHVLTAVHDPNDSNSAEWKPLP